MDEIQKVLIKAGRKDLAQQYFDKIASNEKEMEEVYNRIKKDKFDSEAQNILSEKSLDWGFEILNKYKIKLTKSILKKTKPHLKGETQGLATSGDKSRTLEKIIAKALMIKDRQNPKQFNQLVDRMRTLEVQSVKKMKDFEKRILTSFFWQFL